MRDGAMRSYLRLTGVLFALVALGHTLRLVFDWKIVLSGWTVPMWLSWLAVVLAGSLSLWAFSLAGRVRRF
jgi:hypothetical protein